MGLSVIKLGVTVQTAVLVLSESAVIFKDIKHRGEAGEDKSLTLVLITLLEKLVHELHLTTGLDQMISELRCSFFFDSREQVWMITDLSELNQNVLVVTGRGSLINGALLKKLSVDALLGFSDTHLDMHLNFGQKTLLYLSLDPS